jgi:elongator complex protein 3
MLNLPGSSLAKDLTMFKKIYNDSCFQPDQIKIYPCVVVKGAKIYSWWREGKWQPYSEKELVELIIKIKKITPPWVRIIRVIRDIPEESVIAGNKVTNLRQTIIKKMAERGMACQCIRCREAGHQKEITNSKLQIPNKIQNLKFKNLLLVMRKYKVVGGREYFLSYESRDKKILYAFCRLYLPETKSEKAIIRELHTYGEMTKIGEKGEVQHLGLGKKLLKEAEEMTAKNNFHKLTIIAGVGVREYYRKFGYKLEETYMVKNI